MGIKYVHLIWLKNHIGGGAAMGKTTVVIDEKLLEEAVRASGVKTKPEAPARCCLLTAHC